jgi:hypothetical protein
MQTLEAMENSKATLEAQLTSQRSLLDGLRRDLGAAREGQALAESLAASRGTELEELKVRKGLDTGNMHIGCSHESLMLRFCMKHCVFICVVHQAGCAFHYDGCRVE